MSNSSFSSPDLIIKDCETRDYYNKSSPSYNFQINDKLSVECMVENIGDSTSADTSLDFKLIDSANNVLWGDDPANDGSSNFVGSIPPNEEYLEVNSTILSNTFLNNPSLPASYSLQGCIANDCVDFKSITVGGESSINGECGSANGKTYGASDQSYGDDQQCNKGRSDNTAFPEIGKSVSWSCLGSGDGSSSASCSANRNNDDVTPPPSVSGFSPTIATNDKSETFTIVGANLPDTLAAHINDCADLSFTNRGKTQQTFTCTPSSLGTKEYLIKDKSGGNILKTGTVSVTDISQPVNAQCGSAHGKTYPLSIDDNYIASLDNLTLCLLGSPSRPIAPFRADNTAHWTCLGIGGGGSAQCSAKRADIVFHSIEPKIAYLNLKESPSKEEKITFTFNGENIPDNLNEEITFTGEDKKNIRVHMPECRSPELISGYNSTQFKVSCFPSYTRGRKIIKIEDKNKNSLLSKLVYIDYYLYLILDAGHGSMCHGGNPNATVNTTLKEKDGILECVNGTWGYHRLDFTYTEDPNILNDKTITVTEDKLTLNIVKNINHLLKTEPYIKTYLIRYSDKSPCKNYTDCVTNGYRATTSIRLADTMWRKKHINSLPEKPSFLVSIHTNGGSSKTHGTEAYYVSGKNGNENKKITTLIYTNLRENLFLDNSSDKDIPIDKSKSNIMDGEYINSLIEVLYHSNNIRYDINKKSDVEELGDDEFLQSVASEIKNGILEMVSP